MKVLIDADACPVVDIAVDACKSRGVACILCCDTAHTIHRHGADTLVFDKGADSVDFALANRVEHGDVVVTQDYGVAALALGKGAFAIRQSGMLYTQDNIDQMLMERHLARKARMGKGKHHLKGPKKRTREEDEAFEKAFADLLGGMDNRKM